MNEKPKHLNPTLNMMLLALLVFLSILTTQTSAIAQPVTRAQMAVILGQGIHGSLFTPPAATGIFDDVSVNDWGANWIEQFYNDGITTGCGKNPLRYCPDRDVNRAAIAVFLLRSKHGSGYKPPPAKGIFDDVPIEHWAADWIEQLYREKITKGCCTSPLLYCPDRSVTGIETSLFIVRAFRLPAPIPKTGQIECWDQEGNSIDCEGTGQDGELQRGVQSPGPRFTDNGDGTVTDHLTGLIWLKNAGCIRGVFWSEALDACNNLADGQCGLSDDSAPGSWRLPNVKELSSLLDYQPGHDMHLPPDHPFNDVQGSHYWTSTTYYDGQNQPDDRAYIVYFYVGEVEAEDKECFWDDGIPFCYNVWPVRGGN